MNTETQHPNAWQHVRADGLRRVAPQEVTPLSPGVEDKRIEVDTGQQMVYAYVETTV